MDEMGQLRLERQDREGLDGIYRYMMQDFPQEERKPLYRLHQLFDRGIYDTWLLVEGMTARGYAICLRPPGQALTLLDYFAIFPENRGHSYGSLCLELLKQAYPEGIFLEAESERTAATAQERETRRRRCAFYQRAGFVPCPFPNEIFGVEYLVHIWSREPLEQPERLGALALAQAYAAQLRPETYRRRVSITIPGEERTR